MKLDKISPSLRRKNLANDAPKQANAFVRWNKGNGDYDLIIEMFDNRTGDKYELIAPKDEWVKLTGRMMEVLAKYGQQP